jgi:type I restriction enzyme S subunit
MRTDLIESTECSITHEAVRSSATNIIPGGNVVIATRVGLGKVCLLDQDTAINQDLRGIIPRNGKLKVRFLYHWLRFVAPQIIQQGTGATVQGVKLPFVKSLPVPLPIPSEQERIVAILDEAFEGIATAKSNSEAALRKAEEAFSSCLAQAFLRLIDAGNSKRLESLCEKDRIITYGVIKLGLETPNGVPCLRTSNVRWLRFDLDGMKRIDPILSSEYKRTILQGGEVLVNVRGTLGGVSVATPQMAGWNVSREVAVIPVDARKIHPPFLELWVGSSASQQWLGGVKKGAAYTGINIEDLRNLPVPVAGLDEQVALVSRLRLIRESILQLQDIFETKCLALDALKQSLLHQAFTGKL